MKYFKWNYNNGKFNFGGIAKVYNGLNPVVFTGTNAFYNAFHRAYKGHSIKELEIDLRYFTKEEVTRADYSRE